MTILRELFVEPDVLCNINEAPLPHWLVRRSSAADTSSSCRKGLTRLEQRVALIPAYPGLRGGLLLLKNRNVVAHDGGEVLPHVVVAGHRGLGLAGCIGSTGHYLELARPVGFPQV